MNMRMRKTMVFSLICMIMLAFSACAPDRTGQLNGNEDNNGGGNGGIAVQEQGSGEDEKPDKLIIWSNDDAKHVTAVEQLAGEFTAKTGLPVEVVPVSGSEQVQKLALAAPAGNGPDLFYQPQDRLGDIVVQGLADPVELSEQERAQYSEAALNAVQYEGQIYGFPISIETYAVYYNKALIDQVPAALEDVAELSAALTDPTKDQYSFLMVPDFYYVIPFITNYGGYIFGEKDGKYDPADLGLNNEGSVQGMTAFADFIKRTGIPVTMTSDVMDTLFLEGKAGMVINGLWAMKTYSDKLGDQLGTASIPTVNGKSAPSFVGVKSWFISAYSEHPSWAKQLALFLTKSDSSEVYYENTGEIPARPDAQQNIGDPLYSGFVQQIESGIAMPNIPEMSAVWNMDSAVDFIVQGEDPPSVLDEVTEQIAAQIKATGQ
ncbi:carbohydrate ABC transporter substrate-binding protein, CUT1 family (TC 3.A.1.1.-) [Paenibacillus barengoltzii J12]|uniref:Maltodextrin-binding protein n=2 Tax=Paenibacillus barengoltzii TaxID=343517 RepID=A0ABY1M346_9BACL|nr:carbohydrate ABC transporter substrate-binding protein, CUT1 family (TC 3.A.1.1.-) [Paenibacillus barengoltzii J12]